MRLQSQIVACLRIASVSAVLCCALAEAAHPAYAASVWRIDSMASTTAVPGGQQQYLVQITNIGDAPAPASPGGNTNNCTPGASPPSDQSKCYSVTATFPPGLTPVGAVPSGGDFVGLACTVDVGSNSITCSVPGAQANEQIVPRSADPARALTFTAAVDPRASGILTASFSVFGGGAANTADTVDPTKITATLPGFGFDAFDAQTTADTSGAPFTQAGGTPFEASTSMDFNSVQNANPWLGIPWPVEPVRDVAVELPPGFIGDPTVADTCTVGQLANGSGPEADPLCPATSQVGTVLVRLGGFGPRNVIGPVPVFNMEASPNIPAEFGFNVLGTVVTIDASVRTGKDYGVTAIVHNISEGLAIEGTTLTLWGVPADSSHDTERACPGGGIPDETGVFCQSGAPRRSFLRNPTSCTPAETGLETIARIDSWTHPGDYQTRTIASHDPPGYPADPSAWGAQRGTTGCERVPFTPALRGQPEAGATGGEPSGFAFDLSLPQTDDPSQVGEGDLKKAVVTLPEGVRVSPSSAGGLAGCSPDQIALDSAGDPTCPDASKIGDVTIDTPLLHDQLTGGIYLATPFDNPLHSLVAVYLVARGPGLVIKLPGQASLDPNTGQITTTFDNNPQTPFTNVHLELKSGPRAPLVLPDQCGTYATHAVLTSWSGKTVTSDSSFTLDRNATGQACSSTFSPSLRSGTLNPIAGKSSEFHLSLGRGDSDQELAGLTVTLPGGLTGKIASAQECGDGAVASDTCPAGSKIGDVTVGAGAGTSPFFITNGRAYLTGPYKGAPFGVAIMVPAVAGPFDLGTVTVRSALFVDKTTADVKIVSDPLPTILQGIPLDVRDVRVNVNKSGFFLNPTSCAVKTIAGTVRSVQGASAQVSDRFQAVECGSLAFKPKMTLTVGGRGHLRSGQTTPFTSVVTMPRGNANLRYVRVTLPKTLNSRLTVIGDACTRQQFESNIAACAHAKAGTATAVTPLLKDPLRGGVYFVKNGHPLPDLFVALRGQVAFDLLGRITIRNSSQLQTTFQAAPDVPIRSFTLRLFGDVKNASLGVLRNLCTAASRRQKAELDYIAQNGKVLQTSQALTVKGCPKPRRQRKHGR